MAGGLQSEFIQHGLQRVNNKKPSRFEKLSKYISKDPVKQAFWEVEQEDKSKKKEMQKKRPAHTAGAMNVNESSSNMGDLT
jgi:hypothetical protein